MYFVLAATVCSSWLHSLYDEHIIQSVGSKQKLREIVS